MALESLATHLADAGSDACAQLVAVVASQGHYDEEALAPLLAAQPAFVGLLASRRRAESVSAVLAAQGVPPERLAALRTPVGLDIGARSPGDVAISILAEIVSVTNAATASAAPDSAAPAHGAGLSGEPAAGTHVHDTGAHVHDTGAHVHDTGAPAEAAIAIDPVCGMEVELASARHRFERDGRSYVFCCAGCRASFAADAARA